MNCAVRSLARRATLGLLMGLLIAMTGCGSRPSAERFAATHESTLEPLPVGLVAGESLDAFDSTFVDQSGRAVTLASYHGRPMVLAMVYTHCTSACPLLLTSLRRFEQELPSAQRANTWFVLVTLDPEHDPPDTLRAFANARGLDASRWRLLTGGREATIELAAILGVKVRDDGNGALAHSSNVYLLDDRGVIRHALVGLGADPAELVAARTALR
ncbi:MAG: SCO family protein [Candidatus Eisenbacteria bacterium]|uniref:SCO family protein n=1 Tax=Eiseniibacteriota bacterium TaxID=2212470 RepID=A0A849SFI8_UNCEI|nr:SCO family protein [Candidatus Eisenbacteria bacterium]